MRGKDKEWAKQGLLTRITPAYAGKRYSQRLELVSIRDHPRLCGEKVQFWTCNTFEAGSPPPMRGKGFDKLTGYKNEGITPAYAGKSSQRLCERIEIEDHPRLCGEKRLVPRLQIE